MRYVSVKRGENERNMEHNKTELTQRKRKTLRKHIKKFLNEYYLHVRLMICDSYIDLRDLSVESMLKRAF